VALLSGDWPRRPGWLTLAADAVFVLAYLRSRDIPPFVFYLLLGVVGAVVASCIGARELMVPSPARTRRGR
jgi:hypothetical protein